MQFHTADDKLYIIRCKAVCYTISGVKFNHVIKNAGNGVSQSHYSIRLKQARPFCLLQGNPGENPEQMRYRNCQKHKPGTYSLATAIDLRN